MAFTDPREVVGRFGLAEGSRVADFGCGPGAYTFSLSDRVGKSGRVYAIDVNKGILARLAHEVEDRRLENVAVMCGDVCEPSGSSLGDASVDAVVVSNLLFQLDDEEKDAVCAEAARVLRTGGRLCVVDWLDSFGNFGPPAEHVVPPERVRALVRARGLREEDVFETGDHHYGLIFRAES